MGDEVVREDADSDRVDPAYPHELRQSSQLRQFGRPDRIERIRRAGCSPHLHNQVLSPVEGHQIDFANAHAEVSADDGEAMPCEGFGGENFPQDSQRRPSG